MTTLMASRMQRELVGDCETALIEPDRQLPIAASQLAYSTTRPRAEEGIREVEKRLTQVQAGRLQTYDAAGD